jgi:hypothetical protein
MTPLGHIVSVIAIWTMMLFGFRFAVDAAGWLRPVAKAGWHMARCDGDRRACLRAFRHVVDQLHVDLAAAIQTPWSATLLFGGGTLIGLGYLIGSLGDAARLVSRNPQAWLPFDVTTDCIAAFVAVTGMSFALAATARRRTASFMVSGALILTGAGIGWVTL